MKLQRSDHIDFVVVKLFTGQLGFEMYIRSYTKKQHKCSKTGAPSLPSFFLAD